LTVANASHHVCKCHVLRKAKEYRGNIYKIRETFKEDFQRVLAESLTVDEIKVVQKVIFSEYKLQDYVYLKQMWDVSER
jgi:hypothetical protein